MSDSANGSGIVFEGVGFSYGSDDSPNVLCDVSLRVGQGELVAVLGRNGSGKSTLGLLANGLLVPDTGTVRVDGMSTVDPLRVWDVRTRVGLVFQNPDNQIVGTVVEEDVAFGPENLGVPRDELRTRVDTALATVGLEEMKRREPHLLSGGQKQRLAIAGALALNPVYLVLDEPTAMLDPAGRADVLSVIERLRGDGHGIVHITHDLSDAVAADRVIVLDDGRVAFSGAPDEALADPRVLEEWGLEPTPMMRLTASVRARGIGLPARPLEPAELVEALWR